MRYWGIGLLVASAAGVALAGTHPVQAAEGWYLQGAGGASFQSDNDFDISGPGTVASLDFDTGFNLSGAIGYQTGNWRVEAEGVYFRSDVDNFNGPGSIPLNGDTRIVGLMFNALYEFDLGGIRPYIGAGVGAARARISSISPVGGIPIDVDALTTLFAYQAKAGVSIALTDQIDLFAGYRYFGSLDAFSIAENNIAMTELTAGRVEIHSVEGGLRFYLGAQNASGGSEEMAPANGRDGWYAQASGAAAWLNDQKLLSASVSGLPPLPTLMELSYDTGYGGSGGIGYQSGPWRFEGEVTYLTSPVDTVNPIGLGPAPAMSGDRNILAVMGSVLYEIDAGGFYPFVGLGAGPARVWLDNASGPIGIINLDTETTVFAFQAKAGVTIPLSDSIDVYANYRYIDSLSTLEVSENNIVGVQLETGDLRLHVVEGGLRFNFGG